MTPLPALIRPFLLCALFLPGILVLPGWGEEPDEPRDGSIDGEEASDLPGDQGIRVDLTLVDRLQEQEDQGAPEAALPLDRDGDLLLLDDVAGDLAADQGLEDRGLEDITPSRRPPLASTPP